ncbi:MAG: transglutaminase domain-containing protein [Desulfobacterales bacterium]|nr:transglutaminase domain-containing protein [Desulfobacterales bacterium]MBF0397161.1 transglutaminase domain-containing protein [Desulfobacterales bacterium]
MKEYLYSTDFIDCNNQNVIDYAYSIIIKQDSSDIEKAISLYYAVRDDILYDPYHISLDREKLKASYTLKSKRGFCVSKAVLLAAVARVVGIQSRLGFADVKNHLTTETLKKIMGTDIFTYHGYTELFLNNKWVKATPAFNRSLCDRFSIKPLEFDGINDSIFHAFDAKGEKHMEYIKDHGRYYDLPLNDIIESFKKYYPHMMEKYFSEIITNFEDEAKPI